MIKKRLNYCLYVYECKTHPFVRFSYEMYTNNDLGMFLLFSDRLNDWIHLMSEKIDIRFVTWHAMDF